MHEMADLIEEYLKINPRQSVRSVSVRSGIPYTTLRRIASGREPDFYQALAVSAVVCEPSKADSFMTKHYGNRFRFYAGDRTKSVESMENHDTLSKQLENRIFSLVNAKGLVERSEIEIGFGKSGLNALDNLVEAEMLICQNDGQVKPVSEHIRRVNAGEITRSLGFRLNELKQENLGTDGAFLSLLTRRVTVEKLKELRTEVKRHIETVISILQDEPEPGQGIPVWIAGAMDTLDNTVLVKEEK